MKMIYYYWNIIINIKWTLMMDFKHERNSKREVFYVFPILNEFCIRYIKIFETTYQIQNQQHHVVASYSKHASERGQKKKNQCHFEISHATQHLDGSNLQHMY